MPISRMMPIRAMKCQVLSGQHERQRAPMPADGNVERMVMGWMKLS